MGKFGQLLTELSIHHSIMAGYYCLRFVFSLMYVCNILFYSIVLFLIICSDIVDIKPANMEELTEVITAAEFHPTECNLFVYSSSKGTIRLCDMREQALCDKHAKCK